MIFFVGYQFIATLIEYNMKPHKYTLIVYRLIHKCAKVLFLAYLSLLGIMDVCGLPKYVITFVVLLVNQIISVVNDIKYV